MNNFEYYIGVIAAIVIGVFIIKKITGCLFRLIVIVVLIAIFAYLGYKMGYIGNPTDCFKM